MGVQTIIFDWDGTLARTLELWLGGYQTSLSRRDLTFDPREIVAEFFHNHHEVPGRHPDINFPAIAEETREHVLQASHSVDLYDGAIQTLNVLKDNKTALSLVSSSARPLLESGLAAHSLNPFFGSTIAGDDGYGHKPNTLPFEETLDRMGANARDTLVIGDSHVDILAGKSIGCQTCLFAPPQNALFHDFDHLKSMNADYEIDHLSGLVELI
ncbi:HAD family hydrolase [Pararhizobium sp. IMCC21322]|uniref:HAD family hydrolase n=1 Tax=Pararhizobium sp. IMCC21322 TaxID=3067903 RepID=UPI0027416E71|nr:HAD family hydrolase [Pararhizobium sp. IMCC21322]